MGNLIIGLSMGFIWGTVVMDDVYLKSIDSNLCDTEVQECKLTLLPEPIK